MSANTACEAKKVYRQVYRKGISERARAPEISALLAHFQSCQRSEWGASYTQFDLLALAAYDEFIILLKPDGTGDMVCHRFGQGLVANIGYDMTGKRLASLPEELAAFTRECCFSVLDSGQPLYSVHRPQKALQTGLWERLVMPCVSEDGDRMVVIFTKPLEDRENLLAAVLDASPSGITALRAIRDDHGHMIDAIVTTANRRAAKITGVPLEKLLNMPLLEAMPQLVGSDTWERCVTVVEHREPDYCETEWHIEGRDIWYQMAITPLDDGCAVNFTDISELKRANMALQSRAATLSIEIGRERASARALFAELTLREQRETELRQLAEIDAMTSLLNRRSFKEKAQAALVQAQATGEPLSIVMVDLDHFKRVNDTYGHAAGDIVIRTTAERLLGSVRRETDLVGRLGGEEFVLCLPRADANATVRIAETLRQAMAGNEIVCEQLAKITVTASFGVATLLPDDDLGTLLARADEALYAAKEGGRNRVMFSMPGRAAVLAA